MELKKITIMNQKELQNLANVGRYKIIHSLIDWFKNTKTKSVNVDLVIPNMDYKNISPALKIKRLYINRNELYYDAVDCYLDGKEFMDKDNFYEVEPVYALSFDELYNLHNEIIKE